MMVDPGDARYCRDPFDKKVPRRAASSLIHWPKDMKDWYRRHPDGSMSEYNPTPEEIGDKATASGRIMYLRMRLIARDALRPKDSNLATIAEAIG